MGPTVGLAREGPRVRILLPPAASLSLAGLCLRGQEPRLSARVSGRRARRGRQRAAGHAYIAPTCGNISVGPYSSNPFPAMRLRQAFGLKRQDRSPNEVRASSRLTDLGGMFDQVLSVEDVGVYKPHPSAYRLACNHLGLPVDAIAFVSSKVGMHGPLLAYGMGVFWCFPPMLGRGGASFVRPGGRKAGQMYGRRAPAPSNHARVAPAHRHVVVVPLARRG
jgi:hypothetical protein